MGAEREHSVEAAGAEILRVFNGLGDAVAFCVSGGKDVVLPGLVVEGVGAIGLPIPSSDAEAMIQVAAQAPYGRGEDTIVDTEVRRVWQLEPRQFSLENSDWKGFLGELCKELQSDFGLQRAPAATLYKLLIYEEGSFFLPHRDSEKQDGMFATLVVTLPSPHQGGSLVVRHDGEEVEIDFAAGGEFQLQFAAFYADCWHEVRPLTSGYRVSLIYNLSLPRRKRQPKAPRFQAQAEALVPLLEGIFADGALDKLALPLKHQYTQKGLDLAALKGGDWARIEAVCRAAKLLQYQAYIALVTFHQLGNADENTLGYSYGWGRRRRRSRYGYGYDDDEGSFDASGAEFEYICEESLTLDHWFDMEGQSVDFRRLNLTREELLSSVEDFHMEQWVGGYTGNAGVEMERWYRHAVLVVWPQSHFFRVLAKEGPGAAVPALAQSLAALKEPAGDPKGLAFAAAIIEHWSSGPHPKGPTTSMLEQLSLLGDQTLVDRFLREVMPRAADGTEGAWLKRLCHQLGWCTLTPAIEAFFTSPRWGDTRTHLSPILCIFEVLVGDHRRYASAQLEACQQWGQALLPVIEQWDREAAEDARGHWRRAASGKLLMPYFRALYQLDASDALERYIAHVLDVPKRYPLRHTLIPIAQKLAGFVAGDQPGFPAYQRLAEGCIEALAEWTSTPVAAPADWSQTSLPACQCKHCKPLGQFLQDPVQRTYSLKALAEVRGHVEGEIKAARCDLDLHTDKGTRPYILICTKNRASYEAMCAQFAEDQRELASLQEALLAAAQRTGAPLELAPLSPTPEQGAGAFVVGQSVQVRKGVSDPDDPGIDLSGWQGRIVHIDEDEEGPLLTIAWDSLTLQELPWSFVLQSESEQLDWRLMLLSHREIQPSKARDTEAQVSQTIAALEERYRRSAQPSNIPGGYEQKDTLSQEIDT